MSFGGFGGFGSGIGFGGGMGFGDGMHGKPWGPRRAFIGCRCQIQSCSRKADAQAADQKNGEILLVCKKHLARLVPLVSWYLRGDERYHVTKHGPSAGPLLEWEARIGPTVEVWELRGEVDIPAIKIQLQFERGQDFMSTMQVYAGGSLISTGKRLLEETGRTVASDEEVIPSSGGVRFEEVDGCPPFNFEGLNDTSAGRTIVTLAFVGYLIAGAAFIAFMGWLVVRYM